VRFGLAGRERGREFAHNPDGNRHA
jgi:hypothetical protein